MKMMMLILKPFSVDLTQQKKSQVKKLFAEKLQSARLKQIFVAWSKGKRCPLFIFSIYKQGWMCPGEERHAKILHAEYKSPRLYGLMLFRWL
jgi:hypothetical protein